MNPDPPVPHDRMGIISQLLIMVRSLTLMNALIIILLVAALVPVYVTWRALNDPALLDRLMSHYNEYQSTTSNCTIHEVRVRGGPDIWAVSTGFAQQGRDRYSLSVVFPRQPSPDDERSYCETLNLIVDMMRDPNGKSPTYPGSDEPIIRQYQQPDK